MVPTTRVARVPAVAVAAGALIALQLLVRAVLAGQDKTSAR